MESKSFFESKLNRTGLVLIFLPVLEQLQLIEWSAVVTPEIALKLTQFLGVLILILRTFFTKQAVHIKTPKNPTIVPILACILFMGCVTTYSVKYDDINESGAGTTLEINETVGIGSKSALNGQAAASIDADGAWNVGLGAASETDTTPAMELIQLLKVLGEAGLLAAP